MNRKMLGACFCFPVALCPFFVYTSCSKSYTFSWSGKSQSFSRDYQKYPEATVSKRDVLNLYTCNSNFKKMVGQDVIYKMNQDWSIWSPDLILNYKVSASVNGNRLSWDLQITDEQNNVLLWWTIKQLEYTYYSGSLLSQIQLIPKNVVDPVTHEFIVQDIFWEDPYFDMIVKYRENKDQQFIYAYEFSYKTSRDDRWHLDEILEYIVLTPWYYDGVTVTGC